MRTRVLTGLGIIGLALLSLTAWLLWQSRDLEALEDADLRVELLPAEPDENALVYLEQAAELLFWPADVAEVTVLDALDGDLEAQDQLAGLVKANRESLAALERALQAPLLQVPVLTSFDEEQPELTSWRRLGQLLSLRALEVDERRGRDDLFAALEFGRRVEGASGGNLRHTMTGVAIRRDALAAFQAWIEMTPVPRGESHALARRLGGYATDPEAWGRTWAAEYEALKRTVEERYARDEDASWTRAGLAGTDERWVRVLPRDYLFQPTRTLAGFADLYRTLAENGDRLCSELAPLAPARNGSDAALLPPRNAGGEGLVALASPALERFQFQRCAVDTRLAATQVMAGVRAYWDAHHDLPETLEELVPDYLDALPADPFDGETLRWNLKHAWVYSVGDDFADEGGRVSLVPDDLSEPTYRFLFCAVPFGERDRPRSAYRRIPAAERSASLASASLEECRAAL